MALMAGTRLEGLLIGIVLTAEASCIVMTRREIATQSQFVTKRPRAKVNALVAVKASDRSEPLTKPLRFPVTVRHPVSEMIAM